MLLPLLLASAAVWTLAVIAAPLLDASFIYAAAALVCHQIPERTFQVAAGPVAVCARCLGLYVGGLAGLVAGGAGGSWRIKAPHVTPAVARALLALCAIPTALTLAAEWIAGWPVGNMTRFLTALPLGGGAALVVAAAIAAERRGAGARVM